MGKGREWNKRKILRKLIALGALNDVVQHEHGAMITGLKNEHVLVFGFLMVQDLVDFERHGLTGPHVRDFTKPAICGPGKRQLAVLNAFANAPK